MLGKGLFMPSNGYDFALLLFNCQAKDPVRLAELKIKFCLILILDNYNKLLIFNKTLYSMALNQSNKFLFIHIQNESWEIFQLDY